jgi:hypothetical protein
MILRIPVSYFLFYFFADGDVVCVTVSLYIVVFTELAFVYTFVLDLCGSKIRYVPFNKSHMYVLVELANVIKQKHGL